MAESDRESSNRLWAEMVPELDRAMLSLPSSDRDAVVLRFLEGRSHQAVGEELGISEGAARKRVERGIERLRVRLSKRGVAVPSATALVAGLGNAVIQAPVRATEAIAMTAPSLAGASAWYDAALLQAPAVIGGVAVGLLVTGISAASKSDDPPLEIATKKPGTRLSALETKSDRTPAWRRAPRAKASLEQILADIVSLEDGPQHALTLLQRDVLFASIGNDQMGDFVSLVIGKLPERERVPVFDTLFELWAEIDPEAALTSLLANGIDEYEGMGGSMGYVFPTAERIYTSWCHSDAESASRWLVANIGEHASSFGFRLQILHHHGWRPDSERCRTGEGSRFHRGLA